MKAEDFNRVDNKAERLLRRREVERLVGLKHSAIYQRISRGEFPRPLQLSSRAVAWRESDIAAWQAALTQTGGRR